MNKIEIPSIVCDNCVVPHTETHAVKLKMMAIKKSMFDFGITLEVMPESFMIPFIMVQSSGVQDYEFKGRYGLGGVSLANTQQLIKKESRFGNFIKTIADIRANSLLIAENLLYSRILEHVNENNIVDLKSVTNVFFDNNDKLYRLAGINGYLTIYKQLWNTSLSN